MGNNLKPIKVEIRWFLRKDRKIPKIRFSSWYDSEKPRTFDIPCSEWESIPAWIHEFCEVEMWYLLRDKYNFHKEKLNKNLNIKLYNGKILKHLLCHIITSLHTVSIYNDAVINSSDYAKMIFGI